MILRGILWRAALLGGVVSSGARPIRGGVPVLLAAALLLAAPLSAAAQEAGRRRIGFYRLDDWITHAATSANVTSVAVSVDVAYLGTTVGVERFDALRDSW